MQKGGDDPLLVEPPRLREIDDIDAAQLAVASLAAVVLAAVVASGSFYQLALHDKDVDAVAADPSDHVPEAWQRDLEGSGAAR